MKTRAAILLAVVAIVGMAIWYLAGEPGPVGGSALSRTSEGLFAARRFVEEQGLDVVLLDRPVSAREEAGTLVIAFPAEIPASFEEVGAIVTYVRRGGRLVFAYSGDLPGFAESELLEELGLKVTSPRGDPPIAPLRWREWASARWHLAAPGKTGPSLVMRAPRQVPVPPGDAAVWFRAEDGTPVVFAFPLGAGSVVLLPRRLLSNGWIDEGDNADLLQGLVASGPAGPWIFDEYRQGFVGAGAVKTGDGSLLAFDLLLAHGAFVFIGAVLLLGRRFGQPWRERVVLRGSTAAFLRSLGTVHRELRHHREAARAMLERARDLDPRLRVEPGLEAELETLDASRFVEFAGAIAEGQRRVGRDS